jgi:hypothetical protein
VHRVREGSQAGMAAGVLAQSGLRRKENFSIFKSFKKNSISFESNSNLNAEQLLYAK